jgi:hypothetical protein
MGWGVSPNASERLKIKSEMADYLKGLNSVCKIDYSTMSEMFDFSMELLDKMYEVGIKEKE